MAIMKESFNERMRGIMVLAWQFVKENSYSMSYAMKMAWANFKLKEEMTKRVVCFYYAKVDGSVRRAYGTLQASALPASSGHSCKKNSSVQTYYDAEKGAYRSYRKANLLKVC